MLKKNVRPIKHFFAGFQLLGERYFICDKYFMCVVACLSRPTDGDSFYEYIGISEQRTLRDQYKFKWFVPCIKVVLFMRFQSHYIDRGDKIWGFSYVHCGEVFNTVSLSQSVH